MRPIFVGIIGGIIAIVSIALPWWTMTQTSNVLGITVSTSWNIYPYRVSAASSPGFRLDIDVGTSLWFGWLSLVLVLVGGALGITGGIRRTRGLLFASGSSTLLSIGVFAAGLLMELPNMYFMRESPKALFYFGTYGISPFQFSIYLSFGFWMALIAGTIMLAAGAARAPSYAPIVGQPAQSLPSIERKYCTVCGAELNAGDAYCLKCGAAVPS